MALQQVQSIKLTDTLSMLFAIAPASPPSCPSLAALLQRSTICDNDNGVAETTTHVEANELMERLGFSSHLNTLSSDDVLVLRAPRPRAAWDTILRRILLEANRNLVNFHNAPAAEVLFNGFQNINLPINGLRPLKRTKSTTAAIYSSPFCTAP